MIGYVAYVWEGCIEGRDRLHNLVYKRNWACDWPLYIQHLFHMFQDTDLCTFELCMLDYMGIRCYWCIRVYSLVVPQQNWEDMNTREILQKLYIENWGHKARDHMDLQFQLPLVFVL